MARLMLRTKDMTACMTPILERTLDRPAMMRPGKFDLGRTHANRGGRGARAKPSANGLAVGDMDVGRMP
jgi:hypothetical protein